jgi:hypothetical protein
MYDRHASIWVFAIGTIDPDDLLSPQPRHVRQLGAINDSYQEIEMPKNFLRITACAFCIMLPVAAFAQSSGGGSGGSGSSSGNSGSSSGGNGTGTGNTNGGNGMGGQNPTTNGTTTPPTTNSQQNSNQTDQQQNKTGSPVQCDPAKQAC